MNEQEENEKFIEMLILKGAIEVSGLDSETGEFLYGFTPKILELFPEIYDEHINYINGKVLNLWSQGFLDVRLDENQEMVIKITEKAITPEEVDKLSKEDKFSLEEIKRISRLD
jgi:hypothetical protein